jgi:hypothetical protein
VAAQEVSLVTVLTPLVEVVLLDIAVLVVVMIVPGQLGVVHGMARPEAAVQEAVADKDHMDYRGVLPAAAE